MGKVVLPPLLDSMLEMELIRMSISHILKILLSEIYHGQDGLTDFLEGMSLESTRKSFLAFALEILVSIVKMFFNHRIYNHFLN